MFKKNYNKQKKSMLNTMSDPFKLAEHFPKYFSNFYMKAAENFMYKYRVIIYKL